MPQAYTFPSGTSGFSYIIPLRDEAGTLRAVVGADLNLDELTRTLWACDSGFRSLEIADEQHRILVPGWSPALSTSPEALKEALLQPRPPHTPILAETRIARPGHPVLVARMLEGPEDLAWGWRAWLGVALPPFAAAGLILAFVHRLRKRVIRPLERLARAQRHPQWSGAWEGDAIQELEELAFSIQRGHSAEVKLEELQKHLEHLQRTETLEAMAPGIVHDAKNQLAVAMGNLSLCSGVVEDHPELEPFLDRARGATLRCSEILRALLTYSRAQATSLEPIDVNRLLRNASDMLRGALGRGIRLQLQLEEGLPHLPGERIKIEQVIVNLALNARDAMPEGGVFSLRTRRLADGIGLDVEDTGVGMPADVQARIFEPFFTTKPAGRGTGLGLAMVASIVHAMQGRIQVDSTPGRGTRFTLSFPMRD